MIETSDTELLKKILPLLKSSTVKGKSNDGTYCLVYYKAYADKTQRQIEEAQAAKDQNLDLHVYFGPLESFKTTLSGDFIFTILSLTRVREDEFKYRTFNVDRGEVKLLVAFPDISSYVKIRTAQTIHAVEIPMSWLRKFRNEVKRIWSIIRIT